MEHGDETAVGLLSSPVRRTIVDTLANLPAHTDLGDRRQVSADGLSAGDLAEHLGLHVTTVRFHLDQLVAAGLLRSHFRKGEGVGRPRKLYTLETGSLDSVSQTHSYQLLSELLVDAFGVGESGRAITPEEAGERWGRRRVAEEGLSAAEVAPARSAGQWLGKIGHMVDLLGDWGYTPEVSTTNAGRTARVSLYECPFIALAHQNTSVVCGIHRGLMRGVLESLGEESTDIGLTPFVGPSLCVAALTATAPFATPAASPARAASPAHPAPASRPSLPDKEIS